MALNRLERPEDYLGKTFDCVCGRQHTIPVEQLIYAPDAVERLPLVCASLLDERKALVLADQRTWEVIGQDVLVALSNAGWNAAEHVIEDEYGHGPACDDLTHDRLEAVLPPVGLIVAVGSGVINDLSKWIAFTRQIPYVVMATAASMNGYAAANVAPAIAGVKTLVRAAPPRAIFAVPGVIEQAPVELTTAGLGDILAKPVSTGDWLLNHHLLEEYFCPLCSEIFTSVESVYLEAPEKIREQDPQAIEALFRASVYSGFAMTMVGTSAPASGGEHLLSHTLDMMSGVDGRPHDLHGRQVGLGTIFASAIYEHLLKQESFTAHPSPEAIDRTFWGPIANAVQQQYVNKQPRLQQIAKQLSSPDAWDRLREILAPRLITPGAIKRTLQLAGGATTAPQIGCDRQRLRTALLHQHEIRRRPTVIDLAWLCGILPQAVDELVDHWLT